MLSWGGKNIGSIVSNMNMEVPGVCGRVALYPVARFLQESRQAVGSCKACDNEDEWPSIIKGEYPSHDRKCSRPTAHRPNLYSVDFEPNDITLRQ